MPKFHLTPKQAFAWFKLQDNKHKEIGYGGGAGGGKSILGCLWLLTNCLKYPKTKWVLGRKELTNLKKTTLLSFFQVVDILGLKAEDLFTLNSQTNIITFKNGSMIFLMDMSHQPSDPLYTRFGGLELTGAFVDESNENEIQSIEILKTRMGRALNKEYKLIPKLLETFNPSKNHVYIRYYKPWKDGKLKDYQVFIPALATDNPYLDESYIEQLKNADKVTRERLLYGNFEYDDDPAKLFEYDKICDIFSNDWVDKPRRQNFLTCDVARMGRDKTVIIVWLGLYIHKVLSYPKTATTKVRDLIEQNCSKYKVPMSNVMIDEDGVGGGVVDMLKERHPQIHGFINGSSPVETQVSKLRHNYQNLKTQCYFKLAELVERGEITCYKDIDEESKELIIADLEQISQKDIDKDGKIKLIGKDEMKEKLGRSTDFSDAMMMRCRFELGSTYKPYIAR